MTTYITNCFDINTLDKSVLSINFRKTFPETIYSGLRTERFESIIIAVPNQGYVNILNKLVNAKFVKFTTQDISPKVDEHILVFNYTGPIVTNDTIIMPADGIITWRAGFCK